MKKLRELALKHRELLDYLFWGVMTTVVSWGSYSVLSYLFDALAKGNITFTVALANGLSWLFATAFAFLTNKAFVFRSRSWGPTVLLKEAGKFVSARLATGLAELVAVPLLVRLGLDQTILGIEGMLAKVLVSFAVVLLNYIFSKRFIFNKSFEQNEVHDEIHKQSPER